MSENKCPMPGCDGEIIYHGTEFGTDYDSWHGCTKCHFMCDLDHLTRIAAAMEAENRHNALVEAVAWERECQYVDAWMNRRPWSRGDAEIWASLAAARAEVDRLIANEAEPAE